MSWEKKYFYHYHFYLFLTPVYILLMQFSALEITPFAPLFRSTDPFCQAFSNSGLGNEREKCRLLGLIFWIMVFNCFAPKIQETLTCLISIFLFKFSYQLDSFQMLLIPNLFSPSCYYSCTHVQPWILQLLLNLKTEVTEAHLVP